MNTTVKVTVYEWHPDQFDFGFTDGDGQFVFLNWNLAQEKNLTWKQMQEIMHLHDECVAIFKQMKRTKSIQKLIKFAAEIERIEYQTQAAWGFDQDRTKHTWWCKIPNCTCRHQTTWVTQWRLYNETCPIHSSEEWQFFDKLSQE